MRSVQLIVTHMVGSRPDHTKGTTYWTHSRACVLTHSSTLSSYATDRHWLLIHPLCAHRVLPGRAQGGHQKQSGVLSLSVGLCSISAWLLREQLICHHLSQKRLSHTRLISPRMVISSCRLMRPEKLSHSISCYLILRIGPIFCLFYYSYEELAPFSKVNSKVNVGFVIIGKINLNFHCQTIAIFLLWFVHYIKSDKCK